MIKHLNCVHPEVGFKALYRQEKLNKAARKEEERQDAQARPSPLQSFPKSSPAWQYFTPSQQDRDISICNICQVKLIQREVQFTLTMYIYVWRQRLLNLFTSCSMESMGKLCSLTYTCIIGFLKMLNYGCV